MSSQKRRNRDLPESGRPGKKGRPAKADTAEDEDAASRIYARNLLQMKPRVEWSDISSTLELITDALNDDWTQEDEDAILAIWDRSPEKELRSDLPRHGSYLKLWKVSIRVLNSSPNWIVSPIYGLRYQATGNNAASARGELPSKRFGELLASLITHHCHGRRVSQLALLLQYAAICRLDDRRYFAPFDRELVEKCPALTLLYNKLDELVDGRLPEPLHSMHASARRDVLENEETPSELSDLLHHIGETVMSKQITRVPDVPEEFLTHLGLNVLPLTLWDLIAVIDTVDTMEFREPRQRYTVAEADRSFNIELKGSDIPSKSQLPEIFELTFKAMLRCIRMAIRPETDSSSQGDIDMSDLEAQTDQENEPEIESESEHQSGPESHVESEAEPEPASHDHLMGDTGGLDVDNGEEENDISALADDDFVLPRSNTGTPFPTRLRRAGDNGRMLSSLLPNGLPPVTPIYGSSANTLTVDRDAFETLQQGYAALQVENEKRKEENESLKAKTESLEADHTSLEEEYRSLQLRTMALETENVSLHSKTESLGTKVAELVRLFTASQTRVALPQVMPHDKANKPARRVTGPDTGLNPETEPQRQSPRSISQPETTTEVQDGNVDMDETRVESSHPAEESTETVVEPEQTSQPIHTGENTEGEVPQPHPSEQDARGQDEVPIWIPRAPEREVPVKPNISVRIPGLRRIPGVVRKSIRDSDWPVGAVSHYGSMATGAKHDDLARRKPCFQTSLMDALERFTR
ncbi:hypothetical protein BKA59DRAFT_540409 [Fusarium tricinctum]|uniref:Uncharacterized protein n=1 Tax=Fusarium tricinctum TaxID=61284 RepID=A0A8K0WHI8_9HYPO|nr:hypothetical protein BKA59DRAFT_540409 [Fusarium tricinctum]